MDYTKEARYFRLEAQRPEYSLWGGVLRLTPMDSGFHFRLSA